jgi:hypothetical protein
MDCDLTPPRGGNSWKFTVVDGDRCDPRNSLIRRIFIAISHSRLIIRRTESGAEATVLGPEVALTPQQRGGLEKALLD